MKNKISKVLKQKKVFHKMIGNKILTRRSEIKIPRRNLDIIYLIGIIAGDGSMSQAKRKRGGYHYILRIYSGNEKHLKEINQIIYKNFAIWGRILKDKRKANTYQLIIQNAAFFHYFVLNGCEIGKKQRHEIPIFIIKNKKYFLHYLAGLTDTDGHISHKRIQLKQKSEKLLQSICEISNNLNLNCNMPKVNYTNEKPYYYIRFDNKIPLRLKTNKFLKSNN